MFPGEQNLPVENQGLGGLQGSSTAPTLGAQTEPSHTGTANRANQAQLPECTTPIPASGGVKLDGLPAET